MTSNTVAHQCVRCLRLTPVRPDKCTVCGFPEQTPWFVMVYESRRQFLANRAFKKDLPRLKQQGYEPMPGGPAWERGDRLSTSRIAFFLVFGHWLDLVFPPSGHLRASLRRWDLTPEQATARPDDAIKWGA